jgi:hypothetical protein
MSRKRDTFTRHHAALMFKLWLKEFRQRNEFRSIRLNFSVKVMRHPHPRSKIVSRENIGQNYSITKEILSNQVSVIAWMKCISFMMIMKMVTIIQFLYVQN